MFPLREKIGNKIFFFPFLFFLFSSTQREKFTFFSYIISLPDYFPPENLFFFPHSFTKISIIYFFLRWAVLLKKLKASENDVPEPLRHALENIMGSLIARFCVTIAITVESLLLSKVFFFLVSKKKAFTLMTSMTS